MIFGARYFWNSLNHQKFKYWSYTKLLLSVFIEHLYCLLFICIWLNFIFNGS